LSVATGDRKVEPVESVSGLWIGALETETLTEPERDRVAVFVEKSSGVASTDPIAGERQGYELDPPTDHIRGTSA